MTNTRRFAIFIASGVSAAVFIGVAVWKFGSTDNLASKNESIAGPAAVATTSASGTPVAHSTSTDKPAPSATATPDVSSQDSLSHRAMTQPGSATGTNSQQWEEDIAKQLRNNELPHTAKTRRLPTYDADQPATTTHSTAQATPENTTPSTPATPSTPRSEGSVPTPDHTTEPSAPNSTPQAPPAQPQLLDQLPHIELPKVLPAPPAAPAPQADTPTSIVEESTVPLIPKLHLSSGTSRENRSAKEAPQTADPRKQNAEPSPAPSADARPAAPTAQ
ncbi:hypothetical protein CIP103987_00524 [Corynebacterium diphtheriae]|nr:hypothetical protein [Corynebacterium diphtheriae]CAB0495652.1 hypothetical protein CIP103987_00524 [Corynebacterium diphtheriae]CAB0540120.1 hypothetical protein CIP107526_00520 [Corynebacterium diphtheriae]